MSDIKELRTILHLTQRELAIKLKVHTLTVSRWERGVRKPQPIYERKMERLLKRKIKNITAIMPIALSSQGRKEGFEKPYYGKPYWRYYTSL